MRSFSLAAAACIMATTGLPARGADADLEFFEKKIRPVFVEHCYECHSADSKKLGGNLLLDRREGLRKGGDTGPAIKPGDPDASLLIQAVRYGEDSNQMPPKGKLPAVVIADLEAWVKRGAPDPRDLPLATKPQASWDELVAVRRNWWSLKPVQKPAMPEPHTTWSNRLIDRFVLTKLEASKLSPAAPADARTLARRLSLVLTGLPPTPQQVERFAQECSAAAVEPGQPLPAAAVERLVDELLASPHFGEHWARHWMDVVRFTETHGNEWNYEVHHAWRYRDYLIRAFNADVPYDQFVREHIAGDLLPEPRWNAAEKFNESVIGTAFYRFGEVNHDDCIGLRSLGYDLVDNQLDTLSKAFLGMTVACARCHDHKLDAISMRDYYGLLGVLRSSRQVSQTIDAPDVNAAVQTRLRDQKPALRAELAEIWLKDASQLQRYLLAAAAKRLEQPDAAELAQGLDQARIDAWAAALADEKTPLESPTTPLRLLLTSLGKEKLAFPEAWKKLADQVAKETRERTDHNRDGFTTLADFRHGEWNDWQVDGHGLRDKPTFAGDFAPATEGDPAVTSVLTAGAFTHLLSDRSNGTLRSPVLTAAGKQISVQVVGRSSSAFRLVSNNCQLNYKNFKALTSNEPQWITFTIPEDVASLRTYAELMTMFDNPKFPDQLGQLSGDKRDYRVPWEEAAANPRSFFGVTRVVFHEPGKAPPKVELTHFQPLFDDPAATALTEVATRYARRLQAALEAWRDQRATDDDVRWIDGLLQRGLLTNKSNATPRLESLVAGYRATESELSLPRVIPGIADCGPGFDHPVFVRGDCMRPGEPAPRQFVSVLGEGDPRIQSPGSGRLELAQRLADPRNPLTARVFVNRVWHYLFGTGLVATVDDFGHGGELPSHPELLDYLAGELVEGGGLRVEGAEKATALPSSPSTLNPQPSTSAAAWSLKRLVRSIVLTRTFQMSHAPSPAAMEVDPGNRLLHHYPARRMEAESIRDSILATSGRLDRTQFGMSIPPAREKDDPYHRLFRGPLDGKGRRSVYIKCVLMESPAFLGAFNMPGGKITTGRRDTTNVPEQALALLNDPFVLQQAGEWSHRLVERKDETVVTRIDGLFRAALGRGPTSDERDRFEAFVLEVAKLQQKPEADILASEALWQDVAHAIFNLREFVTIP